MLECSRLPPFTAPDVGLAHPDEHADRASAADDDLWGIATALAAIRWRAVRLIGMGFEVAAIAANVRTCRFSRSGLGCGARLLTMSDLHENLP